MARGATSAEIAASLYVVAEATVKTHVGSIFTKLHVRDRTAAIVFALRPRRGEPQVDAGVGERITRASPTTVGRRLGPAGRCAARSGGKLHRRIVKTREQRMISGVSKVVVPVDDQGAPRSSGRRALGSSCAATSHTATSVGSR